MVSHLLFPKRQYSKWQIYFRQSEKERARETKRRSLQHPRTEVPIMPPPTTTTLARSGSCCAVCVDETFIGVEDVAERNLTELRRGDRPAAFGAMTQRYSIRAFILLVLT